MTTFKKGDIVCHRKLKNHHYEIVIAPSLTVCIVIENTSQQAYVYRSISTGVMWIRPADEMEDGRFSLVMEPDRAKVEELCE